MQGRGLKVHKGVFLNPADDTFEIVYLLENVAQDIALLLTPEFNFAGLPSGIDDRFFWGSNGQRLGQLGHQLVLAGMTQLSMTVEWLGISETLKFVQPASIWTYPVESGESIRRGLRAGPPIGGGTAALDRGPRRRRPLERHHAALDRHAARGIPHAPPRRSGRGVSRSI